MHQHLFQNQETKTNDGNLVAQRCTRVSFQSRSSRQDLSQQLRTKTALFEALEKSRRGESFDPYCFRAFSKIDSDISTPKAKED